MKRLDQNMRNVLNKYSQQAVLNLLKPFCLESNKIHSDEIILFELEFASRLFRDVGKSLFNYL